MDETMLVSAAIAIGAAVLVLAFLPGRKRISRPTLRAAPTGAHATR